MKIAVLIQARLNSKRFPRKILADLNGERVIDHVLKRAKKATELYADKNQYEVIVICPERDLEELGPKLTGVKVMGGSEEDLCSRYDMAVKATNLDAFIRITSDCPYILHYKETIEALMAGKDYVCTTFPKSFPDGLDIQACTVRAWEWINKNQKEVREHPFLQLDFDPCFQKAFMDQGFTIHNILNGDPFIPNPYHPGTKLSIDTEDDLKRLQKRKIITA